MAAHGHQRPSDGEEASLLARGLAAAALALVGTMRLIASRSAGQQRGSEPFLPRGVRAFAALRPPERGSGPLTRPGPI